MGFVTKLMQKLPGFPKNHPYHAEVPLLVEKPGNEIQARQVEALQTLATSVNTIATFLTNGGLQRVVADHARGSIMQAVFGGLAAHDGRKALDARTIQQNSLEIVECIEQVFAKMNERMKDKNRDPEIHEPEE